MGPRAFKLRPPPQHLCGSPGPVVREENWAGRGGGGNEKLRESGRWWFQLRRNCRRHHRQDLTFSAAPNPLFCDKLREGKQNKMGKYRWGGGGREGGGRARHRTTSPFSATRKQLLPNVPQEEEQETKAAYPQQTHAPQPPRSRWFELLILIPPPQT